MGNETGRLVILAGLIIVVVGIIIYLFSDKLQWVGNLPGDIRIEKENFKFYFPFSTMILISVILNVAYRIIKYFMK